MIKGIKTNFEKGKIAEKIVGDLFKEAGFKVIQYGYEFTVPKLADQNNLIKGKAAEFIRHQPDLIVVNKNNEAFFVEVKYRREGKIKKEHMFPYPEGYVVFLTKDGILAQSIDDIYDKGENFRPFKEMKPFSRIDDGLINKYVNQTKRKLGDETLGGQILGSLIEKVTKKTLSPVKPEVKPEIEGGGVDLDGWERLQKIQPWILRKIKTRKAKRLKKDVWLVHGDHYKYKIVYENRVPLGYKLKK